MASIDPSNVLGTGDIKPPPGLKVETEDQKNLYRASMEFERFFLQNMMKSMNSATKAMAGDEKNQEGTAGVSNYQDMAQDQMVQSMLDGGGIGLAATMYQQMGEQSGILDRAPITHIPTGVVPAAAAAATGSTLDGVA
ncbi:MAG: rod-binding protein [Thermoleophilia bacterium]|nr:rod-binding protein [Thermoleophilia bacterium]